MARNKTVHFQRVTFSFPSAVAEKLRIKVGNQNMSKFVVGAVQEKLIDLDFARDDLFVELDAVATMILQSSRTDRTAVELIREMRDARR